MVSIRRLQSFTIATLTTFFFITFTYYATTLFSIRLISPPQSNGVDFTASENGSLLTWNGEQTSDSRFAYAQYATDLDYFCSALINAQRLRILNVKADIVIIYPEDWSTQSHDTSEARMLSHALELLPQLVLQPIVLLSTMQGDTTWRSSLTKFHVFNLNYTRILYFDADSLILSNVDNYFLSPPSPLAVPRAYWLTPQAPSPQMLCSHIMLLQPSQRHYDLLIAEAQASGQADMEVINRVFGKSAMVLPHSGLALLTGEFRSRDHRNYLADEVDAVWDAKKELETASLVHFSGWPLPKPWLARSKELWEDAIPSCEEGGL